MKTKFWKHTALALLFTAGFYACETELPPEDTMPKITMTVEPGGLYSSNTFSFYATGTDTITIDWGDGTVETYMLRPRDISYSPKYLLDIQYDDYLYTHTYSEIPTCTITVTGGKITQLEVQQIFLYTHWDLKNQTELVCFESFGGVKGYIDFSGCPALEWLSCGGAQLTGLDITGCPQLVYLASFGREHPITNLDVSNNTKLTHLQCDSYQLTNLDVSNNAELITLRCSNNQLTNLDVSNNVELINLLCSRNQLTSLDVSNNTKLDGMEALICSYNNLSTEALNWLFETLHSNPSSTGRKVVDISGNPGKSECNPSIAEDKGWEVR